LPHRRLRSFCWTCGTGALGADLQFLKIDPRQVVGQTLEEYFRSTGDGDETVKSHQHALNGKSVAFETEWLGGILKSRLIGSMNLNGELSGRSAWHSM